VTTAHRLGNEVWAFASPAHRTAIETACTEDPMLAGIKWFFPEVAFWKLAEGQDAKWERTHNLLWQISALRLARKLVRLAGFDAVHHLTWGGVRAPTFLGAIGVPLIIGPLGGGEVPPPRLRKDLCLKARSTEWIRNLSNATIRFNPILRAGLDSSCLIIAKTPASRAFLPRSMQRKSVIFSEITLVEEQIGKARQNLSAAPRLLFVGRLLYWKGGHIALAAFAHLKQSIPSARLTIVGKGPEAKRLRQAALIGNLVQSVDFVDWLPRDQVTQYYESHDLLVFPSLHDSSGNAVLEALSRGLPVICLDIGGPCEIVTADCGRIVGTAARSTQQVAQAMANEMQKLFADKLHLAELSFGAISRATQFMAADRIGRFYALAADLIQERADRVCTPTHSERTREPSAG